MKTGKWKKILKWERWVPCKREGCDYMGMEIYTPGGWKAVGVCTKCGHIWEVDDIPEHLRPEGRRA